MERLHIDDEVDECSTLSSMLYLYRILRSEAQQKNDEKKVLQINSSILKLNQKLLKWKKDEYYYGA